MTVNRGPGVAANAGVGTTTLEHRLQLAGQYAENAPGVPRSGVLAQSTALLVTGKTTMVYDIGPCALVISRTAGEGVYTPTLTGTTTVATTAAPATNSRWDLIWVKQNDTAKGDADNLAVVGVTQGAAGATPSKPYGTVPAGAYVLAEAQIFATTTGTSGGSNTVAQVWRHTAARGAPVPVRNTTERAEITAGTGTAVVRLDLTGLPVETYDGSIWILATAGIHLELARTASANTANALWGPGVPSELTAAVDNNASRNPGQFTYPTNNQIAVTKAGLYSPSWAVTDFSAGATGFILIRKVSTGQVIAAKQMTATGDISVERGSISLAAGEALQFNFQTSVAVTCKHLITLTRIG